MWMSASVTSLAKCLLLDPAPRAVPSRSRSSRRRRGRHGGFEPGAAVIAWRPQIDGAVRDERDRSVVQRFVERQRRFSGDAFAVTVRRDGARCPFIAVTASRELELPKSVVDMLRDASGRRIEISVEAAFFIDGKMSGGRQPPVVTRVVVDDGEREARSSPPPGSRHGEG
jgi:hypothetical protein